METCTVINVLLYVEIATTRINEWLVNAVNYCDMSQDWLANWYLIAMKNKQGLNDTLVCTVSLIE